MRTVGALALGAPDAARRPVVFLFGCCMPQVSFFCLRARWQQMAIRNDVCCHHPKFPAHAQLRARVAGPVLHPARLPCVPRAGAGQDCQGHRRRHGHGRIHPLAQAGTARRRPARFNIDDLERYILVTGDTSPIEYLASKFLSSDAHRKARAIARVEALSNDLAAALASLKQGPTP